MIAAGVTIAALFFIFFWYMQSAPQALAEYHRPSPTEVVTQYFTSWNSKDIPNMYATLSDGFKKIEPTARTLDRFREYLASQEIAHVTIKYIQETLNDGASATVDYDVTFEHDSGNSEDFSGSFTLAYRTGDIIQGWKLIHPYGEHKDTL